MRLRQSSKALSGNPKQREKAGKLGREFAFRRHPLSGRPWKKCVRAFPLSCRMDTMLKRKQSLQIHQKPFLERCSCRVLAEVGETSGSQQEGHEKGNRCDEAREGAEGSSDGSVESALN